MIYVVPLNVQYLAWVYSESSAILYKLPSFVCSCEDYAKVCLVLLNPGNCMSTTDCECCSSLIYFLYMSYYSVCVCTCVCKNESTRTGVLFGLFRCKTACILQVTDRIITMAICVFIWPLCMQNPQGNYLNKDKIWYLAIYINVYLAGYRKKS